MSRNVAKCRVWEQILPFPFIHFSYSTHAPVKKTKPGRTWMLLCRRRRSVEADGFRFAALVRDRSAQTCGRLGVHLWKLLGGLPVFRRIANRGSDRGHSPPTKCIKGTAKGERSHLAHRTTYEAADVESQVQIVKEQSSRLSARARFRRFQRKSASSNS